MLGKVILITGATSGIGYKTAEYLAAQGNIVYGAGRRIESLENIKQVNPLKLDLTNEQSKRQSIQLSQTKEELMYSLIMLVMVHMVQSKMSQLKKRNSNLK